VGKIIEMMKSGSHVPKIKSECGFIAASNVARPPITAVGSDAIAAIVRIVLFHGRAAGFGRE
jgi:hypothetical protein